MLYVTISKGTDILQKYKPSYIKIFGKFTVKYDIWNFNGEDIFNLLNDLYVSLDATNGHYVDHLQYISMFINILVKIKVKTKMDSKQKNILGVIYNNLKKIRIDIYSSVILKLFDTDRYNECGKHLTFNTIPPDKPLAANDDSDKHGESTVTNNFIHNNCGKYASDNCSSKPDKHHSSKLDKHHSSCNQDNVMNQLKLMKGNYIIRDPVKKVYQKNNDGNHDPLFGPIDNNNIVFLPKNINRNKLINNNINFVVRKK